MRKYIHTTATSIDLQLAYLATQLQASIKFYSCVKIKLNQIYPHNTVKN